MSQPEWKFVDNLGDANPIEHGGFFVYVDTTEVYDPEAEVLQFDEHYEKSADDDFDHVEGFDEDFDEQNDNFGKWTVYRFSLVKCTLVNGVLSDNKHHPESDVWWHNRDPEHKARHGYDQYHRFCEIAASIQLEPEELEAMFCSDDVLVRASAYQMITGLHGYYEFDQYPREFTSRKEIEKRYEKDGKD